MAKGAKAARVHEGVTALVRQGGRERREGGKGGVGAPGGRAVNQSSGAELTLVPPYLPKIDGKTYWLVFIEKAIIFIKLLLLDIVWISSHQIISSNDQIQ